MLSLKETKTMSGMDTDSLALSSPPAIVDEIVDEIVDDDSIVNSCPNTTQTISIVIPLPAQLTSISSRLVEPPCKDCPVTEENEAGDQLNFETDSSAPQNQQESLMISQELPLVRPTRVKENVSSWLNGNQRADKTKGCPFPSCSRYGRAFSRAHDLKRHIARHETRKERFVEMSTAENRTCSQCGESFSNEAILQKHTCLHSNRLGAMELNLQVGLESGRIFSCGVCKKKYMIERKFKTHLAGHAKKSEGTACPLCDYRFDQEETLQNHIISDHTTVQQEFTKVTDKSTQAKEDDDDFMLEEMLLLNKNPRIRESVDTTRSSVVVTASPSSSSSPSNSSNNKNNNKIRCDYCSKTFKTKWTLSSHVAAHEGRFQFGCTRCGKKFVRKSHFEGHVRSHEAARPYVCEQCGKTFKELKHRREHTKRKHPGNRNAIQNLLDSACISDESTVDQAKFTLLMPINFGT